MDVQADLGALHTTIRNFGGFADDMRSTARMVDSADLGEDLDVAGRLTELRNAYSAFQGTVRDQLNGWAGTIDRVHDILTAVAGAYTHTDSGVGEHLTQQGEPLGQISARLDGGRPR